MAHGEGHRDGCVPWTYSETEDIVAAFCPYSRKTVGSGLQNHDQIGNRLWGTVMMILSGSPTAGAY